MISAEIRSDVTKVPVCNIIKLEVDGTQTQLGDIGIYYAVLNLMMPC